MTTIYPKRPADSPPEHTAAPVQYPAPTARDAPQETPQKPTSADDNAEPTRKPDEITPPGIPATALTKTEKIALGSLFAVLMVGAILALVHFANRVPTRSPISEETQYPVSGNLIEVRGAETFWRKPVTSGDNPDIVRRNTALIPVVKLSLNSKPGAIRVFFRDDNGIVIGDGISRDVEGVQEVVVAATAGFDDVGMHAAYRTGETEPWTVEVFEGPSLGADRTEFRKILETRVSTDRH